jgi:hypothetical protein
MGLGLIRTKLSHDNLVPFRSNLKKPKNNPQGARGWESKFYFFLIFFLFFFRGSCKNLNSGGKKKRKEKEKIPKIVATFIYACSQGQVLTAGARTPLVPKHSVCTDGGPRF